MPFLQLSCQLARKCLAFEKINLPPQISRRVAGLRSCISSISIPQMEELEETEESVRRRTPRTAATASGPSLGHSTSGRTAKQSRQRQQAHSRQSRSAFGFLLFTTSTTGTPLDRAFGRHRLTALPGQAFTNSKRHPFLTGQRQAFFTDGPREKRHRSRGLFLGRIAASFPARAEKAAVENDPGKQIPGNPEKNRMT